jgi:pyruvate carboxylase
VLQRIHRLLVANRGEIAVRVMRAASELEIPTVAIYSQEDSLQPASHQGGRSLPGRRWQRCDRGLPGYCGHPAGRARSRVDAIHPGYGFLSENPKFAQACKPMPASSSSARASKCCEQLGDKLAARRLAQLARCRSCPAAMSPSTTRPWRKSSPSELGYPVIVKASMGRRRPRHARRQSAEQLDEAIEQAQREAGAGVRRDRRLPRKIHHPRSPHRGAAPRRSARQPRPSLRTRLLAAAPPSESRRARSGAEPVRRRAPGSLGCAALAVGRRRLDNASTVEFLFDVDGGKFTSSRSTRASRSSTPSPRRSPATT